MSCGIYSEGICLISPFDDVAFCKESDRIQLFLCKECGIEGCETGNWCTIRKVNSNILFIPAFKDIGSIDFQFDEYSPPEYFFEKGIPVINNEIYETIFLKNRDFPKIDDIQNISRKEIALTIQFLAKNRSLGKNGDTPKFCPESFVACSQDDIYQLIAVMNRELLSLFQNENRDPNIQLSKEYLIFNDMSFDEWYPFKIYELLEM